MGAAKNYVKKPTADYKPKLRAKIIFEFLNSSNNGATLGNNLAGQYANLGGSRSAATSPVGVSSTQNISAAVAGGLGSGSGKEGSPRHSNRTSNEEWVCPNDRQLALRAK